jgi:hypothetical protein
MIKEISNDKRTLRIGKISTELLVAGGGLAGVCASITAARAGLKVVLVQDRPVLGGNSSSEVRLWILGATSHMGNNNRWAREGGLVDEILVENTYRNPEGNPVIFDSILLDKVASEPNITLLLNTAIYELTKSDEGLITSVTGFCSQNSIQYEIQAKLFCDTSGDGILGFLAGAAFRMGAEAMEEFGEKFAPSATYGELLGHSMYFYSKDTGKPVKYIPPSFALSDITKIPRFKSFNANDFGCKLWWIEFGGRLDTVHDTEQIKWELWKVVYGTWNYIKNSGEFPEAENLTLEWVGAIPGKRESRRFEGDYLLKQQDIVEQRTFEDAVGYGGWSIDLHPSDGVFSEKPGCNQWHSKGIYQIPYRCLYSRNVKNLFLAGRIISATHVAFGSSRVMATGAYLAQVVGEAAKICLDQQVLPASILNEDRLQLLRRNLTRNGHYIPGFPLNDPQDLMASAKLSASSELVLTELPDQDVKITLDLAMAQMLPLEIGAVPELIFHADAEGPTELQVDLVASSRKGSFSPDEVLEQRSMTIHPGRNCLHLKFTAKIEQAGYYYITFRKNKGIRLHCSQNRITGILTVYNQINKAVSNFGKQSPLTDIGVDEFEFWCPKRRPEGHNIAMNISPGLKAFGINNVLNGIDRPTTTSNAWVAALDDLNPTVAISWETEQTITKLDLLFDTDYDHPMESVLMTHPENIMPFCVRNYTIEDEQGKILYSKADNYTTKNTVIFNQPFVGKKLVLRVSHPSANVPAAIFGIRCY